MHRYNNSNNFINYSEHTDHSNNFQNLRQNYFLEYTENVKQNTETCLVLFSTQWKIYFRIFKATLSPTDNATTRQIFSLTEKVRFLLY